MTLEEAYQKVIEEQARIIRDMEVDLEEIESLVFQALECIEEAMASVNISEEDHDEYLMMAARKMRLILKLMNGDVFRL